MGVAFGTPGAQILPALSIFRLSIGILRLIVSTNTIVPSVENL
jgi:hypothetical protein